MQAELIPLHGKCTYTAHAEAHAPRMQADRAAAEAYGADALISALRKV